MPGHKGECFVGAEPYDITEIEGADVLYSADGIIAQSLDNAKSLFGTKKTLYSTEGSSLCIRAMIRLALERHSDAGKPWILAARNAHKTFLSACALLDVEAEWIYPQNDQSILSCRVTAEDVESAISSRAQKPIAVYVTSPDYLGNVLDVEKIARACHKFGVILMVDNAHGAYLDFLPQSRHPIALGADMCCDSAHKTLPVLTGGAYLHISKTAPDHLSDGAEQAMALFASTSPSYLILQSLDRANAYIENGYREKLALTSRRLQELRQVLCKRGFCVLGDEPLKLTVAPKSYGYTGKELASRLFEQNIVCEFSDEDFCVMMFTPNITSEQSDAVEKALLSVERRVELHQALPSLAVAKKALSIREAMLSPSEEIDVNESFGRILASPSVSCPPAVPVLVCGEVIDESAIKCFKYYGIEKCRVVK